MNEREAFDIFFREKPAMMLIKLFQSEKEMYASSLAKHVDCTYSHVVKILQQMEKLGLVNFNKKGRLKLLSLTKKGHDIAGQLDVVRRRLIE